MSSVVSNWGDLPHLPPPHQQTFDKVWKLGVAAGIQVGRDQQGYGTSCSEQNPHNKNNPNISDAMLKNSALSGVPVFYVWIFQ